MLTAKCIGCGCTDDHACVENGQPCHWLRVNRVEGIGVCSSCPDALNQFASTSQEQATGQDDYRNSPEWKDFSSRCNDPAVPAQLSGFGIGLRRCFHL